MHGPQPGTEMEFGELLAVEKHPYPEQRFPLQLTQEGAMKLLHERS